MCCCWLMVAEWVRDCKCCSYSNLQVGYFYFLGTVLSLFYCSFFPVLSICIWKFFFNVARLSDFVTILLQPFNPITYTANHYEVRNKKTSLLRINKFLRQNLTLLHMHTFVGQIDLNLIFFSIIKLVNLSSGRLLFTNLSSPRPHVWPCNFVIDSKFGI